MGWAFCGVDKDGRPIGYGVEATCDAEGCEEKIDRGLGYACGGMHGQNEVGCDRYFCPKHLSGFDSGPEWQVCVECEAKG